MQLIELEVFQYISLFMFQEAARHNTSKDTDEFMYCCYCFLIGFLNWSREKGFYVKNRLFSNCSIYSLFHLDNIYLEHNRSISFWTWTSVSNES